MMALKASGARPARALVHQQQVEVGYARLRVAGVQHGVLSALALARPPPAARPSSPVSRWCQPFRRSGSPGAGRFAGWMKSASAAGAAGVAVLPAGPSAASAATPATRRAWKAAKPMS